MNRPDFKRIDEIFNALIYDGVGDVGDEPALIRELLGLTGFLASAVGRLDLQRQLDRYLILKQPAAKKKLWEKMHGTISGLQTEVSIEKASFEAKALAAIVYQGRTAR